MDYMPLLGIVAFFFAYFLLTRKTKFESTFKYMKEDKSNFADSKKNTKYFTSDPSECIDIQFAQKGIGSFDESPPMTVMELCNKCLCNAPDSKMLAKEYKDGSNNYKWKYWTRKEMHSEILSAARAFIALGLNAFESVCIMGFNSPQWFFADLAAIYSGGLAVGLYTTNNVGQCEYILNNCNARILVVQNQKLLNKFLQIKQRNNLGNVCAIIVWEEYDTDIQPQYDDLKIMHWEELIHNYGNTEIDKYNKIILQRQKVIKPGNCCTIIWTSGTTGTPKGVMLSHDNLIWTIRSVLLSQKHIHFWGEKSVARHAIISYLPLSHIAAQLLDIYGPLMIAYNDGNGTIYFARNDALKGSLIKTLSYVKPTVFLGVPRVWEKIEAKMRLIGKRGNFVVKFISKNAKAIGLRAAYNKELGGNMKVPLLYWLVNKLIFASIKKKLGFGRLQLAITGAAPIKKSTTQYFHSLGICLIEGFGMSESSGLISMGLEFHNKIGCQGAALLGVDLRIIKNENNQNEICVRGRNVMMGYINNVEKTKDVFCVDGFLKTGDIGMVEQGTNLLYVTGRIKEIIITAGGLNIAPVPIEDFIKTLCSAISNCVVIGDNRKYLTMLITLKTLEENGCVLEGDAFDIDVNCKTVQEAKQSKVWETYIANGIKTYNEDVQQCESRAHRIQYFSIMDQEFTETTGEMTSTLKLKRNVIVNKYSDIIDSMYNK